MDWIFNNWKYQILPTEEVKEEDDLQSKKPSKNNYTIKNKNKKNFTEEYNIYYRNGILSFDTFETLESLEKKCGEMNYEAIIYIIQNNNYYKGVKDNVYKIKKIISDNSNNEEIIIMNIICGIGTRFYFIDYKISGRNNKTIGGNMFIKEYNECIEELKINLVMLDMYIRKNLQSEYSELFI